MGQLSLRTRISGDFEGWDGETVFVLDTGNILKQVTYAYTYRYAFRPEVLVIDSGGLYRLIVDDVDSSIGVMVLK